MKELKYSEESIIFWCDEYYKVIKNAGDYMGTVMDLAGEFIERFYFEFGDEKAELIIDKNKIKEINDIINNALKRKCN